MIQNNLVRASPNELMDMDPGIVFALIGMWRGHAKWLNEMADKRK